MNPILGFSHPSTRGGSAQSGSVTLVITHRASQFCVITRYASGGANSLSFRNCMKVAARRGPLPKEARLAQGFAVLPPQRSTSNYAYALLTSSSLPAPFVTEISPRHPGHRLIPASHSLMPYVTHSSQCSKMPDCNLAAFQKGVDLALQP